MKRLLVILLVWIALAAPAFAIGTPVQIAAGNASSGSTVATSADAPIGSYVIVVVYASTSPNTVSSLHDSAGNCSSAYNLAIAENPSSVSGVSIYYCRVTADLPSGGTFTATTTGSSYDLFAFYVPNVSGSVDQTVGNGTSSAVTSIGVTTGTLAQPSEIAIGTLATNNSLGTFTEASGFTSFTTAQNSNFRVAYRIVSATAAVTYSPSWSTSRSPTAAVATFKATPPFLPLSYVIP